MYAPVYIKQTICTARYSTCKGNSNFLNAFACVLALKSSYHLVLWKWRWQHFFLFAEQAPCMK